MNYYNFVNTILDTSKSHKFVYEVGEGDIYEHLNSGDHKYPCVFLTVQNVDSNGSQMTVTGSLFYVDSLLSDTSNKLQIQSTGMTTLQQIFMRLMDNYPDFELRTGRYTPFDEKFSDLCAGVFSNFTISFMDDTCIVNDDIFEGDEPITPEPEGKYMTMTVLDGDTGETIIRPNVTGSLPNLNLQYRINNGNWNDFIVGTTADIHVVSGDWVQFKGVNENGLSVDYNNYMNFAISGNPVSLSGNVMSLIDGVGETTVIPNDWCFQNLFIDDNIKTVSPDFLPATTLKTSCYENMFNSCTELTTTPELPSTDLTEHCYLGMFGGCTSLTTAPELPATVMALGCYNSMFKGCTSLTTAPELPATQLYIGCYSEMFSGCTSLTTAPELPATTLESQCYFLMFKGCTSLNYVKCLAVEGFDSHSIALTDWLSGVADTGTFVKKYGAEFLINSPSGIPQGWTIEEIDAPIPPEPEYVDWVLDKNSYIVGYDGQYYERLVRGVLTKPEVYLNENDWKVNTVSTEYDVYDDFDYYMSDKNWHVYNSFSQCKISWKGTNRFNLKYRSSSDTWNYLVIGPLDGDKFETRPSYETPGILATTRDTSNNQYRDLYIDCDEGEHHVWVAYRKSDTNSNDDRGYIGVPKQILSIKQEKQGNVLPNDYVASDSEYTKLDESHLEINKIRRYILPNGTIVDNNNDTYKENILCDYLTYTLVDGTDSTVITLEGYNNEYNGKNISLEYQINDGNWVTWDLQKQITLTRNTNGNGYIKFRGVNPVWGEFIDGRYAVKLKSSSPVNVSGNILSLIGGEKTSNELNTSIFCLFSDSNIVDASKLLLLPLKFTKGSEYLGLFMNCYLLETPPELPCMSLYSRCYQSMFNGCRSLKTAPFLPCDRIPEGGYAQMFKGCVNLKEYHSLPGLNIEKYSYEYMFDGCTSLEKVPSTLPAKIVSESAYRNMFRGCTMLKECPEIKGTRVSKYSYESMFENCKSIKNAPFLYPTEMSNCDLCYYSMFAGCISLEKGPSVLPALRIRDSRMIYDSMFKNCVNLKECSKLPATSILTDQTLNLGTMEYESMFEGCVNITESPILPLEFVQKDTYKNMFKGCSKLQKVTCLATNITYYPTCTENWLEGVAEKGTFVKKSGTDWSSKEGYSGIPSGWTIEEI